MLNNKLFKNDRKIRLKEDYEQIKLLFKNINEVSYIFDGDPPNFYKFTMKIKSYIDKFIKQNEFVFYIELPPEYPNAPPLCYVNNIPFHPHFKKKNLALSKRGLSHKFRSMTKYNAIWVDYEDYDPKMHLGDYILKIAHSLQYENGYINEDMSISNVGNPKALEWFKNNKHKTGVFPADNVNLPPTKKNRKRFDLEKDRINNISPRSTISNRKKKFEINETTEPYKPREKNLPQYNVLEKSSSKLIHTTHRLLFVKESIKKIQEHIGWGILNLNFNRVEQGGILIGEVYINPENKQIYGIVRDSVPARSAQGTGVYLQIGHDSWKEMFDYVDQKLDESNSNLQIIGWYHTHPNSLSVFMSGTDQATQRRMFANEWQFAVVLNPHHKKWKVFYGIESKECFGEVIQLTKFQVESQDNNGIQNERFDSIIQENHYDNPNRNFQNNLSEINHTVSENISDNEENNIPDERNIINNTAASTNHDNENANNADESDNNIDASTYNENNN